MDEKLKIVNNTSSPIASVHEYDFVRSRLIESRDTYAIEIRRKFLFNGEKVSKHDRCFKFAQELKDVFGDLFTLTVFPESESFYVLRDSENEILITFSYFSNSDVFELTAIGDHDVISRVVKIGEKVKKDSYVDWYYLSKGGQMSHSTINFEFDGDVRDCHYPFITKGLDQFNKEFLESTAPVLVLMGVPGTGKSTWIKNFIKTNTARAMLTHDAELMANDQFLIKFLTEQNVNTLIIEDADDLIKSRDLSHNFIMSKLLNISDGILPLTKGKKIIMTTNITQVNKIDSALIRRGRCFDIINFRELTDKEANKVCEAHDLHGLPYGKDYTLAEIFNQEEEHGSATVTRTGFLAA